MSALRITAGPFEFGADWVEARGGRVVRVPLFPGYSTTSLVERLRAPS